MLVQMQLANRSTEIRVAALHRTKLTLHCLTLCKEVMSTSCFSNDETCKLKPITVHSSGLSKPTQQTGVDAACSQGHLLGCPCWVVAFIYNEQQTIVQCMT